MRPVLILSVAQAREIGSASTIYLRIAPISSEASAVELDAAMAYAPQGIFLEQAANGSDVARLAARIAVAEARHGLPDGRTRIIASTAHDGASLLSLSTFRAASPRLDGLAFDAAALSSRLAVTEDSEPIRIARAMALFAAHAAGAAAVAGPFPSRDPDAVRRAVMEASQLGYTAALATSPEEAEVIRGDTARA
jgi:citrate lyase subunit beta / citryl-CoA lyase